MVLESDRLTIVGIKFTLKCRVHMLTLLPVKSAQLRLDLARTRVVTAISEIYFRIITTTGNAVPQTRHV
jgi:hypothetical protein